MLNYVRNTIETKVQKEVNKCVRDSITKLVTLI